MRHAIQRMVLGALVVLVAVTTAVGGGQGASAEKRPDFSSRKSMELECEIMGGTFEEDVFGDLHCSLKNGARITCDANGKDCWYYPEPSLPQPRTLDPFGGLDDQATADIGEAAPPPPAADSSSPTSVPPSVSAPDEDQHQDHGKRKGKGKGKKGKKGGKGRRK